MGIDGAPSLGSLFLLLQHNIHITQQHTKSETCCNIMCLRVAPISQAIDMSKAEGGNLPNVFYLRNTVDADALLSGIKAAKAAGNKVSLHLFFCTMGLSSSVLRQRDGLHLKTSLQLPQSSSLAFPSL